MARVGSELWGMNYETFTNLETLDVKCGNAVCDADETAESCAVDCNPVDCTVVSSKMN